MMIKTITCHDVYNTGAGLQAYALQKYLSDLGHHVEIIDYKPDYLSNHYSFSLVPNPRFNKPILREMYLTAKFPSRIKALYGMRKRNFDHFTKEYLLRTRRYHSAEELEKDPPQADVFFAGSDQIWNTSFKNGKDRAFYLSFAPDEAVKASYAASFAVEQIPEEWSEKIKAWLMNLDYISVREESGKKILSALGIEKGVVVADPVFLLPKEVWSRMCGEALVSEPYIFVYDFDGNPLIKKYAAELAAEKRGTKIVTMQDLGYGDRCFSEAGPIEFLNLVYHSEFILSNSFHATAFSIIFEKQFLVFNRNEKINTRMFDLTARLNLENRMVTSGNYTAYSEIRYDFITPKVTDMIQRSKQYISRVLGEEND